MTYGELDFHQPLDGATANASVWQNDLAEYYWGKGACTQAPDSLDHEHETHPCATDEDPVDAALRLIGTATIRRNENRVTATLPETSRITVGQQGVEELEFNSNVTFNVGSDNNSITLSNITGVQVRPSYSPLWFNITNITIRNNDTAVVTAGGINFNIDLNAGGFNDLRAFLRQRGIIN